jgi:hypothetical protein
MPVKTSSDTEIQPPEDYCPDRSQWVDDTEDVFYVPPELRADYCRTDAPPSNDDMRRLWNGGVRLNRVIRERRGRYVWAPPIPNTGNLAVFRPNSPDVIAVDALDELHVAVWRHTLRRNWAEKQIRVAEDIARWEAAQPRCEICSTLLAPSPPVYRPWTKGRGRLCPSCTEAINLAGALRHLETHRAAIDAYLEQHVP